MNNDIRKISEILEDGPKDGLSIDEIHEITGKNPPLLPRWVINDTLFTLVLRKIVAHHKVRNKETKWKHVTKYFLTEKGREGE